MLEKTKISSFKVWADKDGKLLNDLGLADFPAWVEVSYRIQGRRTRVYQLPDASETIDESQAFEAWAHTLGYFETEKPPASKLKLDDVNDEGLDMWCDCDDRSIFGS